MTIQSQVDTSILSLGACPILRRAETRRLPFGLLPVSDCDHALMPRFTVTIEGQGWADVQVLELPRLPREGELIETKYGTCVVTHSESTANTEPFAGKIVCSNS